MATRAKRDMTVEEFDAWAPPSETLRKSRRPARRKAGRGSAWCPMPTSVPVDFLPDEVCIRRRRLAGPHAVPFTRNRAARSPAGARAAAAVHRDAGRNRLGPSRRPPAGLSARSAYGLRARSPAFAAAWDTAEQLAVGRLSALAFDRAIHGRIEQVWQDGELVGEKRVPSDRLLMWLLARLDPEALRRPVGAPQGRRRRSPGRGAQAFPALLDGLTDVAAD